MLLRQELEEKLRSQTKELARAAMFSTRKPLAEPDDAACAATLPTADWRNLILEAEVNATPFVRLVPFHRYSQPWGATLHRWAADCSHVCYTPYYHAPLWHGVLVALLQQQSGAQSG